MVSRPVFVAERFRMPVVVFLLALFSTGCVPSGKLSADNRAGSGICQVRWDSAGGRVAATVPGGLELLDVRSGDSRRITLPAVTAFDWLSGGEGLLVATAARDGCRLWRLGPEDEPLLWREMPGLCRALVAGDADVRVLTESLSSFTFGGNVRLTLWRIANDTVDDSILADLTLSPPLARRLALLQQRMSWSALSPQRDVLLYAEPHDPPAMAPYLRFMAYHLASGAKWPIVDLPWTVTDVRFSSDGETVVLREGAGNRRRVDLWSGEERTPASGEESLADRGDVCASFSPDGRRLAVRHRSGIELVAVPSSGTAADLQDPRRLELRRWRSQGLIDGGDYRTFLERIERP